MQLTGWGRYPIKRCRVTRPESVGSLPDAASALARGYGRSYGDSALNSHGSVLLTDRLTRILDWQADSGVVTVEPGLTIGELLRFTVPRGHFLPVVPGTQFVSIGGAVAADIHGKNHHIHGSFGNHIVGMKLRDAENEVHVISPTQDPDLFWSTIGGMGLTGIIESVSIKLLPIQSEAIHVTSENTPNLEKTVERLLDSSQTDMYRVAWLDALAKGKHFGRGNILWGSHADAPHRHATQKPQGKLQIPFVPAISPLNSLSIAAFNSARYRLMQRLPRESLQHYEPFFFPLDGAGGWNKLYGPSGFTQYQITLPLELESVAYILERLQQGHHPPYLVVLKDFGKGNDGLISFPHRAFTLAMDIPIRPGLFSLLDELDEWVLGQGGRVYLAKDVRLHRSMLAAMYPGLQKWLETKRRIDPKNFFRSDQSIRLSLH